MSEPKVVHEYEADSLRYRVLTLEGMPHAAIQCEFSPHGWTAVIPGTHAVDALARLAAELKQEKTAAKKLYVGLGCQVEKLSAELEQSNEAGVKVTGALERTLEQCDQLRERLLELEDQKSRADKWEGIAMMAQKELAVMLLAEDLRQVADPRITDSLAAARREGAEEMRERAATKCEEAHEEAQLPLETAGEIRALPLRPEAP